MSSSFVTFFYFTKIIFAHFRWYEYRNNIEDTFLDISGWQWITSQWPMTLITFVMTLFWRYCYIQTEYCFKTMRKEHLANQNKCFFQVG